MAGPLPLVETGLKAGALKAFPFTSVAPTAQPAGLALPGSACLPGHCAGHYILGQATGTVLAAPLY